MSRSTAFEPRSRPPDKAGNATSLTLIDRVKVDDTGAWRQLVTRYSPFLRYWCRCWGVDREDVDDVLQEIFQAVCRDLKDFRRDREGDSFRGWLRGIARHKALSWHRGRGERGAGGTDFYHRSLQIPDPGGTEHVAADGGGDAPDVLRAYRQTLNRVRDEFEDRTWQAFWRAAVEGEATDLIAESLGVTPAAVRQAKSRVLRRFKELLGGPLPSAHDPQPVHSRKNPVTPRAIP